MSLCPKCGRYLCDHTPAERGQSVAEMLRPMSAEEEEAWRTQPANSPKKIAVAKRHAHDPVTKGCGCPVACPIILLRKSNE